MRNKGKRENMIKKTDDKVKETSYNHEHRK